MAFIVLGSVIYVLHVGAAGNAPPQPRENLRAVVQDALLVLAERPACVDVPAGEKRLACWHTYGPGLLGRHVIDSLYGDTGNVSAKLAGLLPPGARFNLFLDNGATLIPLKSPSDPGDETVSTSITFAPRFNFAWVVPDFSCYDPTVPINVTTVPVVSSSLLVQAMDKREVDLTNGVKLPLPHQGSGVYSGYLGGHVLESDSKLESAFTYNTLVLRGRALYDAGALDCPFGSATFTTLRSALNASAVALGTGSGAAFAPKSNFTLADTITVSYSFASYFAAAGSPADAKVRIVAYDPVPPPTNATRYRERFNQSFATLSGEASIPIGDRALYGPLLVCAEASGTITSGAVTKPETARKCALANVLQKDGSSAFAPTYRLVLEAWFPEWE